MVDPVSPIYSELYRLQIPEYAPFHTVTLKFVNLQLHQNIPAFVAIIYDNLKYFHPLFTSMDMENGHTKIDKIAIITAITAFSSRLLRL